MIETRPGFRTVALSVAVYRLLVAIYPEPFREEYGPHMVQVFRDANLATLRREGAAGLPPLWGWTLFDLMKTAAEEHMQRSATMSRETFIRLSGWGLIAGVLLLVMAFSGIADESSIRRLIYDTVGPVTRDNISTVRSVAAGAATVIFVSGMALITLGILGLQLRYGRYAGRLGETSLWLSLAGGVVATGIVIGWSVELDIHFKWFFWSVFVALFFLGLFGIAAIRTKPMRRGNALPLLAGWPLALNAAAAAIVEQVGGTWPDWGVLNNALPLVTAVGLVLLGFVLAEAPSEEEESIAEATTAAV